MTALPGPVADGALLVIDVQNSFADPAVLDWVGEEGCAAVAAAVERTAALVEVSRAAGLSVIWVSLVQHRDAPWEASLWLRDIEPGQWPGPAEPCVAGTTGTEIYSLQPAAGELQIAKQRYSSFFGTDLHSRLGESGVKWLLVAGLTTECCVLATVFDAAQLGYHVVLVEDATASYEASTHEGAVTALTLHAAKKASTDEVVDALGSSVAAGSRSR